MPKPNFALSWDAPANRLYEVGIDRVVLYKQTNDSTYPKGVAWNGVTTLTESSSGAEETKLYADNIKYLSIRSAEEIGGTIEAYTYPDEWKECDGRRSLATGVEVSQQVRKSFGLAYRTTLGNDVEDNDYSYKLHLFYNLTAAPTERSYATINDSPEAITFSWELASTPITMPNGLKASSLITINAAEADAEKLATLEQILYGSVSYEETDDEAPQTGKTYYTQTAGGAYVVFTGSTFEAGTTYYEEVVTDARLPLPEEVYAIFANEG